jgi:hypothetical protein
LHGCHKKCHASRGKTLKTWEQKVNTEEKLNEAQGKKFKSLGFGSRQRALDLVQEARKRARKNGK